LNQFFSSLPQYELNSFVGWFGHLKKKKNQGCGERDKSMLFLNCLLIIPHKRKSGYVVIDKSSESE